MKTTVDLKPILHEVARGDQNAFRQIFNLYSSKVYTFALKLTHTEAIAEEIVQDVFMKVWMNRESLISIQYFPSYLYTIARNHTFNILKRIALEEKAKAALSKELTEAHHETEEAVIYHEYQQIVRKAIKTLPPQQRLVYSLCHQKGLKYEEVAQRLSISRLTVKTHMQQALRSIKSYLSSAISLLLWIAFM